MLSNTLQHKEQKLDELAELLAQAVKEEMENQIQKPSGNNSFTIICSNIFKDAEQDILCDKAKKVLVAESAEYRKLSLRSNHDAMQNIFFSIEIK